MSILLLSQISLAVAATGLAFSFIRSLRHDFRRECHPADLAGLAVGKLGTFVAFVVVAYPLTSQYDIGSMDWMLISFVSFPYMIFVVYQQRRFIERHR